VVVEYTAGKRRSTMQISVGQRLADQRRMLGLSVQAMARHAGSASTGCGRSRKLPLASSQVRWSAQERWNGTPLP
jgi:hypothetical protein